MTTISLAIALAALILAARERYLRLQAERIAKQALDDLEVAERERKQAYARGHEDGIIENNARRDWEQARVVAKAEQRSWDACVAYYSTPEPTVNRQAA